MSKVNHEKQVENSSKMKPASALVIRLTLCYIQGSPGLAF